jgi:hypothetical protein
MKDNSIEISSRGRWVRVPAWDVNGRTIIIRGRWIKTAVIHDEAWLATELEDPDLCVKTLTDQRSKGLHADLFAFSQKPSATLPRYKYHLEWDSLAVARTSSFKDWWENLPQETRKNVRRSQKRDVVIVTKQFDDDLVRDIVALNDRSPVRQGIPDSQFGKTFDEIKKDHSSFLDRSEFICAYWGGELVGFLKLVYRGEVASILNFAPSAAHQDKRPANALIAKAIELCEAKGALCLTYGFFNYGNKRDSPLRDFKIRNGFTEVLTPRFYVPLTRWGGFCLKLKLHRGLLGILPSRMITAGLSLRGKWYNFTSRNAGVAQR